MRNDFTELVKGLKNHRDILFRKQLSVFLICIVISFFIWLLINFSRTIELLIPYKVTYNQLPEDLILVNPADSMLTLKLKANGFMLISVKYLKRKDRLYLNLQDLNVKKNADGYLGRLYAGDIRKMILGQLGYKAEIVSVYPDTLTFFFEEAVMKKLAVVPDISISYAKQYQIYGKIICIPDSVEAKIPRKVAKRINYITTEKQKLSDLNQNKRIKLYLLPPYANENIILTEKEVELIIPVEKYTEGTMEIPINTTANDELGIVKLFPSTVKITYKIALKDFNNINQRMFTAEVRLNEQMIREVRRLKIEIVQSPENITITRLEPEKVEFILQK